MCHKLTKYAHGCQTHATVCKKQVVDYFGGKCDLSAVTDVKQVGVIVHYIFHHVRR